MHLDRPLKQVSSTEVLQALQDPSNQYAWQEFCARYQPAIVSFAQHLGLPETDAHDAGQETLMAFLTGWREGKYERGKGRLRNWLLGIARNKVLYEFRRRKRQVAAPELSGTGFFERLPDEAALSDLWEAEWRQTFIRRALDHLRDEVEPRTLEAFELVSLKEWPAEKVAEQLSMSVNAVLKANRRVLSRMREFHRAWELEE